MPFELEDVLGTVGAAVGGAPGSAVGTFLGGLFGGGGTPSGTTQFDGLHSPTLPPIKASSYKDGEVKILVGYATAMDISVEETLLLMQTDAANSRNSLATVFDAWGMSMGPPTLMGSPDTRNARIYLRMYNQAHPAAPIIEGEKGPRGGGATPPTTPVPTPSPVVNPPASSNPFTGAGSTTWTFPGTTPVPVPGNAAGSSAAAPSSWQDYLKLLVNGAKTGVIDAAMQTPAGQQAKKDGINSFLKDNQLIIAGTGAALVGAFLWAFNRNPSR